MASRAILRRRNIFSDFSNLPACSIQSILSHRQSCQSFDSHSFSSGANHFSQTTDHRKENDETSVLIKELLSLSNLGIFRHKACGSTSFHYGNGRLNFNCLLGVRLMSQSTCYASTATAKKLDLGSGVEDNEKMTAKKKKEASPEECDQAVVGLRAVASKSRENWVKKLVHRKNEFISTLNENDNNLETYIVHVETPDGKSFTDSEELYKWYDSFLPENTPNSRIRHKYKHVIQGFSVRLSPDEVKAIKKHKGVLLVWPSIKGYMATTHSPTFLGLQRDFGTVAGNFVAGANSFGQADFTPSLCRLQNHLPGL